MKKIQYGDSYKPIASGEQVEIDKEIFDYFLGVLPPVAMGQTVILTTGRRITPPFCFAEGAENMIAFWEEDEKFYACKTRQMNPYA